MNLLDHALNRLSLSRAHLLQVIGSPEALLRPEPIRRQAHDFKTAEDFLNQAVTGLREAGEQEFIARGLLARAALYRVQGEFTKASADLNEGREIAKRGGMGLHLADYHLEACRVCLSAKSIEQSAWREKAKEHLNQAAEMIAKMGYGRRQPEVEILRQALVTLEENE